MSQFPNDLVKMKTGSYLGDGADNRAIDIGVNLLGASFKWLAIKSESASNNPCHKFGHETGDATDSFTSAAQAANLIQAWTATGFQIGSGSNVNNAGETFNYVVFYTD